MTEDAALEIALGDHPEWRRAWERGDLPDEITGEDGQPMSPRAHLHIHAIVERQLAADEPKGVLHRRPRTGTARGVAARRAARDQRP